MAEEIKVQLGVEVDATGAKAGFEQVKAGARDMADSVSRTGQNAGKGIEAVGTGGEKAATKVDRSTRSMISAIQRANAEVSTFGKGASDRLSALAELRGLDPSKLAPYVEQLRQAEAAQAKARNGLDGLGISAKQTANALRGVPAQFTDIAVSLQGGQNPLSVLLQQGGQLKDMFGGIGDALRAMVGYVVSLVTPFTVILAAAGALAFAFFKGSQEASGFREALILSGNAAGVTAGQLQVMSARMSELGGTQGAAAEALTAFAQSGAVGAANLERFAKAAQDFERATGTSIGETVKHFEELKKAPLEASIKLNESFNYLTESTYKQIKALVDQGRETEAVNVAQTALAAATESMAGAVVKDIGLIEKAWRGVRGVMQDVANAAIGIGRTPGLEQQIQTLQERIGRLRSEEQRGGAFGRTVDNSGSIAAAQQQLAPLQEIARLAARSATSRATEAEKVKALIEFDKQGAEFLSKKERMEREITKARNQGAAAGVAQEEIEKRIAGIREKYADKGRVRKDDESKFESSRQIAKDWARAYEDFIKLADEAEGKSLGLSKAQQRLVEYLKSPEYQHMAEPARQLVLEAAYAAIKQEQLAEAIKNTTKEAAEASKEYEALVDARQKAVDGLGEEIKKQIEANEVLGLSRDALALVVAARVEDRASSLDRRAALLDEIEDGGKLAEGYRAEAKALRDLAAAKGAGADKERAQRQDTGFGFQKGLNEYLESVDNVAETARKSMVDSFKGMEDALTNFVTTGKLDFKSLANSIISDLIRVQVQQSITRPLAAALGGGGSGFLGVIGGFLGLSPGKANGGPVGANSLQEVNERGPELLTVGGKSYLMMGAQGGTVTPNGGAPGEGGTVNNYFTVGDVASMAKVKSMIHASQQQTSTQAWRSMNYGGALS